MTNNYPEIIRVIAWFGIAFFCGVMPIFFAAILTYAFRKRNQLASQIRGAKKLPLGDIKPGMGLVRVQGIISPASSWLAGDEQNALVYLRLHVDIYEEGIGEDDHSEWKTLIDKETSTPFYIGDGSMKVRVNPNGLDRELVCDASVPNEEQIDLACNLLGISPSILRGRLRFQFWQLRAGEPVTVVAVVRQVGEELELGKAPTQPLIISTYLGNQLEEKISGQIKKTRIWAYILGIPGILFFLCGLCNGLIGLVRWITR